MSAVPPAEVLRRTITPAELAAFIAGVKIGAVELPPPAEVAAAILRWIDEQERAEDGTE